MICYFICLQSIGKIIFNYENCGVSRTSASRVTSLFSITLQRFSTIQEHLDATAKKTSNTVRPMGRVFHPFKLMKVGFLTIKV